MSWSTITKKNVSVKSAQESTKKPIIEYDLLPSNEIFQESDILKINKEETLFNDLLCIKKNTEQFTPWILSKANTYDILDFLYKYIDLDTIIIESYYDSEDIFTDD